MTREERMNVLNNNGVEVGKFFNVSMQIPFGAKLEILVDGQPMQMTQNLDGTYNVGNVNVGKLSDDYISELKAGINDNGYVKNTRLWRRFVMAQTFRMLNSDGGWNAAMNRFDYKYQFEMLLDELHTQTALYRQDGNEYAERNQFFNQQVVVELVKHYIRQLKKYINGNESVKHKRAYKVNGKYVGRKEYVRLHRYGDVFLTDLPVKVFNPMEKQLQRIMEAETPYELEVEFRYFYKELYNKLPYNTPKNSDWKTAYKASGAYYSMKNLILFHNVKLIDGDVKANVEELNRKARDYSGYNGWRLHEYMKKVIEDNNFDFNARMKEIYS